MRLDAFLVQRGDFASRNKAAEAIKRGEVSLNGEVITKSSKAIDENAVVVVKEAVRYASLGGYKLKKAVDEFNFPIKDLVFADVGASTGGFTDCLLQEGAKRVYAIDVGEGLLAKELSTLSEVIVVDNTNARELDENSLPEKMDAAVADCSFISLKLILNNIKSLLKPDGFLVALIKPQFECGKKAITKSGVLTDITKIYEAVKEVVEYALKVGFKAEKVTPTPFYEGKNAEFLTYFSQSNGQPDYIAIKNAVYSAKNKSSGKELL